MPTIEMMKATYDKHLHLKNAAAELGMKWQTLYWYLKKNNHPVTGNKTEYGGDRDRLAALGESIFKQLVPHAIDKNISKFQPKYDFDVGTWKVDIKTSRLQKTGKHKRWAFSVKKQNGIADMFVCIAMKDKSPMHYFLIPGEIGKQRALIVLPESGNGKWWDYEVTKEELADFFQS